MNLYQRTIKQMQCINCGELNHHFRNCKEPIFSYGIIALRTKNPSWNQIEMIIDDNNISNTIPLDELEILMIQRKDSIGFIELLRAKYKLTDIDYIKQQIAGITFEEKNALKTKTFEELWITLWGKSSFDSKQYNQEYEQAKYKFEQLQKGVEIDDVTIKLDELLDSSPILWKTPEWGFPKGRRNLMEKNMQCAIREFCEETGLKEDQFIMYDNILPIKESFIGNNNVHYCHIYYLAWIPTDISVVYNPANEIMSTEIGNVQWFSYNDASSHIRSTNKSKQEILEQVFTIIQNTNILLDEKKIQNRNHVYATSCFRQSKSEFRRRKSFNFVEDRN
jgi:ADP-ribose pyrophosphatase YjhB (NUDIX family)